jgi:putative transcriptional regulator
MPNDDTTDYVNLTNQFLVAMPTLMDPNFHRTVTYICEHSSEGAMGIVVNRPLELKLDEIMAQMDIESGPALSDVHAYYGGPVDMARGFVLHTPVGEWEATLEIGEEIGVTSSRDILIAMAQGNGPAKAIVALGYSGWGAGQLESELVQNAWLTCPANLDIMFDTDCERKLEAAAARLGVDLNSLTTSAGHA